MTLARHAYAVLGLAAILTALSVSSTHHTVALAAPSQTQNVNVVNTPSVNIGTLPAVQIGASNTVSVGNQPTVNIGANQTVGISGEPTVHVDGNDTVNVSGSVTSSIAANQTVGINGEPTVHVDPNDTVQVGGDVSAHVPAGETIGINNTGANPIPVDPDVARTPADGTGSFVLQDGQTESAVTLYTVPAGKMLIVQNVSVEAQVPTGQVATARMARQGSLLLEFMIPLQHDGAWGASLESFTGALTGTNFACKAGDILTVAVFRPYGVGYGTYEASFSGYLVNAS